MFISIVLNTEYMDIASRKMWYLKNLLHCKDNGWILITHEYMKTHFEEIQNAIQPSLFESWEMRPFSVDELQDVEQYFIPDELFEKLEKQAGSRTEFLYQLSSDGNETLESFLQNILDEIQLRHSTEKIDGVFHCLEAWKCIRNVCQKIGTKLIPYSFSAFRKPHGYRQTLFHANLQECMHSTNEVRERYHRFLKENHDSIPVFSHRELVALIGKERTLPLIPLIDAEPKYEIGLCTECFSVIPQFFVHDKMTDDDVRFECEKLYDKSQITVRNHSLQVDYMQLDRSTVHNDPAAWILGCRRIAIARSQILLKALLWNRTAIVRPDTLGFSFMCEKDYASTGKVDLRALNFYIFCYLIPNELMFSGEYWHWRMTNPTESEIYQKHLDFYQMVLGVSADIFSIQDENLRFAQLLKVRGCDNELVTLLTGKQECDDVDFSIATSKIMVDGRSYWRLNHNDEMGVHHFQIELSSMQSGSMSFYPLDDVAGCARIIEMKVNNKSIDIRNFNKFRYLPKVLGAFELQTATTDAPTIIDILWEHQSIQEYLNHSVGLL